ncbi:MAG: GntR family transcriptional regulator [Haliscomenobacter sp.]
MSCTISINQRSAVPKYRQIVNSIVKGIETRTLGYHEQLPSINEVSIEYDVSRDTVEKAYKQLKRLGVIVSVPGKGYFAAAHSCEKSRNVLLVFNKLSAYKKAIFDSFVQTVGKNFNIDFQVYHENYEWFEKIITEKANVYSDYIIIPSFKGEEELKARALLNKYIPKERLWLLNDYMENLSNGFGAVFQNYEKDVYAALTQTNGLLHKYERIQLIFPNWTNYSRGIIRGTQKYCTDQGIPFQIIVKDFEKEQIQPGVAYLVILDHDLVTLVKKIKEQKYIPGKDIGILAYNDSPLKEVLLDGISVMSTDHDKMGATLGHMLINNDRRVVENEFSLILRNSI